MIEVVAFIMIVIRGGPNARQRVARISNLPFGVSVVDLGVDTAVFHSALDFGIKDRLQSFR